MSLFLFVGEYAPHGKVWHTPGQPGQTRQPAAYAEWAKKFKVYVRDPDSGNVKIVRFGDSNMNIKRDDNEAKRNFRSRHNCSDYSASDKTKPGYWSCKAWSDNADWV